MFAKFIQRLRKKFSMTQEWLAAELGVSRPTYLQIEQGKRDLTISEAKKLATLFGMSLENFLAEREPTVVINIAKDKKQQKKITSEKIRISVPQKNAAKFKQVLLYILKKVGGKPNVGMAVLYKFLYFIDFDYYEKYEDQLMGLAYIKNHYGPTPVLFKQVIDDLVKQGVVEAIKSKFYNYPQTKYLVNPAIEPDLTVLNGREKEHIDWELQRLSDLTAMELSNFSHKDVPWISTEAGKQIEYESVFYRTAETSVRVYDNNNDEN
jgi:DNA-binding XRE family transcriptional regulator